MKKPKLMQVGIAVMIIAMITVTCLLAYNSYYIKRSEQKAHERIDRYINSDLSYEEAAYEEEIQVLSELSAMPYVSDSDRGHVYERLAQIYKFKDDTLSFYHTMGSALYYLEKSENTSIAVNIYEDIANYYITDNNYAQAEKILEKAYEVSPIEDISDPQVRSYAYRMQAIIFRHKGEFEKARRQIDLSTRIVNDNPDTFWYGSYLVINDAVLGGIAFDEGLYNEAREILKKNEDSEYLSPVAYADIITRDFILPYYDTACKLAAREGRLDDLDKLLAEFTEASEKYGFYKKELSIILSLLEDGYDLPEGMREELTQRTIMIYDRVSQIQSDEYAEMINSPLESGMREQELIHNQEVARTRSIRLYLIVLLITLIIIVILSLVIHHALTDELTRIGNRRALDYYLKYLTIMKVRVTIAMMDVDNFKKVNDTYGHDQGDAVLMRLGSILKDLRSRHIRCFRYGGEEFVFLARELDKGTVLRIADSIRTEVSYQKWEFPGRITVSIGVSDGRANKETVRLADENMYHSKTHGKNAVSYDINGEKTILRDSENFTDEEGSSLS